MPHCASIQSRAAAANCATCAGVSWKSLPIPTQWGAALRPSLCRYHRSQRGTVVRPTPTSSVTAVELRVQGFPPRSRPPHVLLRGRVPQDHTRLRETTWPSCPSPTGPEYLLFHDPDRPLTPTWKIPCCSLRPASRSASATPARA